MSFDKPLQSCKYKHNQDIQIFIHQPPNYLMPLAVNSLYYIYVQPNLYAVQEETFRTGHGTTDWFQIWKGVHQACTFSPCLFNLYAEYIMQNLGLDEAKAGIKIAGRNINNLR